MALEEWIDIPGYEGVYLVSDHGRVMRVGKSPGTRPGKVLSPGRTEKGYLLYVLSVNGETRTHKAHHLVMEAFEGPRPDGQEVNHRNGVRDDNRRANLEYVTQSQNIRHQYQVLQNSGKLVPKDVRKMRQWYEEEKYNLRELADRFGVDRSVVGKAVRGTTWGWVK